MSLKSLPLAMGNVVAEVTLPGSKSLSNRVFLIASIAEGQSVIENIPLSKDVLAGIGVLKALGIKNDFDENLGRIMIQGSNGYFPKEHAKIFCNEAGTLTRFIIPLCAAQQSGEYHIYAGKRMMRRPIAEQLRVLEELGMAVEYKAQNYKLPITILAKGLKQRKVLSINGNQSSQFLSGLLITAPLIEGGLKIYSKTDHRQPYVQMTVDMMRDFGISVDVDKQYYQVAGGQSYQAGYYAIEPDISTASYFWGLAAITHGNVKIKNVRLNAKQGDIRFLEVLQKMGCTIISVEDGISVIGSQTLKGVSIDMRNFSDTFMTVAAIACFAEDETHITGLSHTRFQESDRVSVMAEGLMCLGMKVTTTIDSIHIYPKASKLKAAIVEVYDDHRIAMSLALIGLRQEGVVINGAECVSKSCPDYFERMEKIIQLS